MADPNPTPAPLGRRRFYLKQRIGQGAFGEVFLAEQDSGAGFRRPVAIKLLNQDVAGSREAARRMRDEARILGRLHHRNIVGVLDLVRVDDRWAVIMDYVPGADLEQVLHALEITGGRFPAPAAFEIGAAICRALHAAWHTDDSQGKRLEVIHRDIKPSNVRVTTDGEVKVLDFGVARVNNLDTREAATKAGGWIGTERYMAPERILMEGDTPAGDVYAAGASVAELILGRPLGKTPVFEDAHRGFVLEALTEIQDRLTGPQDIVGQALDLLGKALSNRPTERPATDELAKGFAAVARRLEGESLAAFCAEFVPKVPGVLGYTAVPVSGVLTENSDGGGPRGQVGTPSPMTIIPDGDEARTFAVSQLDVGTTPAPTATSATAPVPAARRSRAPAAIAAAVLVVVLLVFAGTRVLGGSPAPPPPPVVSTVVAEPAPAPVPEPAPEPAPEPVAALVAPPVVAPAPRPARPAPAPAPAPAVTPEPAPDAPLVGAALVVLQNAAALEVRCGARESQGTASVRISDFPAGPCTIRASWLGKWLETEVRIDKPREVRCSVTGDVLSCS